MSTAIHVLNGRDRLGKRLMVEGVIPLDRKVTTDEDPVGAAGRALPGALGAALDIRRRARLGVPTP